MPATTNNCKLWFNAHDDALLDVRHFTAHEAISDLFTVSVTAVAPDEVDLDSIVGKGAALTVHRGKAVQSWSGICSRISQSATTPGAPLSGRATLFIVPYFWRTSLRRNNRIFQHASIPDIVLQLLGEWGVPCDIRHFSPGDTTHYPTFEYRVQYGESDFAFISRLLEEAGISYYFSHPQSSGAGLGMSKLVLDSAPQSNDPYGSPLPYASLHGRGAVYDEFIANVGLGEVVLPGAHTIRDYDFRRKPDDQALYNTVKSGQGGDPTYEQYGYDSGSAIIESPGIDKPIADWIGKTSKYDATYASSMVQRGVIGDRGSRRVVTFETNAALCPGITMAIGQQAATPSPRQDLGSGNPLLIIESSIDAAHDDSRWLISCRAVDATVSFQPARRTPKPRVGGVQSALVIGPKGDPKHPEDGQEIVCDEFGRVFVQFHWDRDHQYGVPPGKPLVAAESSCWVRVAQMWAGGAYGSIAIPRVGHEVLVDFFEGDPDQPVIVGRVYNSTSLVPYPLPQNKTVTGIKTDSSSGSGGYNELAFDDLKGQELIRVQAERNVEKVVKVDENVSVGQNHTTLVGTRQDIDVGEIQQVTVGKGTGLRMDGRIGSIELIAADGGGVPGGASIVLAGNRIVLNALDEIHIHTSKTLRITAGEDIYIDSGKNTYINCASAEPAQVYPFGSARPPLPGGTSSPGQPPSGSPPQGPIPKSIDDVTVPAQPLNSDVSPDSGD